MLIDQSFDIIEIILLYNNIISVASMKNDIKIVQYNRKPSSKTDQLTKLSSCCHAQFYVASCALASAKLNSPTMKY